MAKEEKYSLLYELAQLCGETQGGSWVLSRLKRTGEWQVSFFNKGVSFHNNYLEDTLIEAIGWIKENRMSVENEIKYTLYKT